jgi:hypothetical protein
LLPLEQTDVDFRKLKGELPMLRLAKLTVAVCLMSALMTTARAAPVAFVGTVSATNALFSVGTPVAFTLSYTPAVGGVAAVTAANVTIGLEQWIGAGAIGSVTIVENGAAADDLDIAVSLPPSLVGGLGSAAATLTATIFGQFDLGPAPDASIANVNLIAANGNPGSGVMTLVGSEIPGTALGTSFSGEAIPEPGTVALLGGLGIVFSAGAWRRRRREKQEA